MTEGFNIIEDNDIQTINLEIALKNLKCLICI